MGRPPQQFCWDNVEKLTEKKWKCKHCNEIFKGSASRIREHLAGEGKNIRHCKAVPAHIRDKASKIDTKKDADAIPRCSFTRLRSIMQLQDRIKAWLSDFSIHRIPLVGLDVLLIINSNEFWSDGKEILEALTPLFRIIDVGDSLVPTAGYLRVAIDKVKHGLKPYYDQNASKYLTIWKSLDSLTLEHKVAAYLSPVYDWREIEGSLDPVAIIKEIADSCLMDGVDKEEKHKLMSESEVYRHNNPFPKLSPEAREVAHPVTLWNEYGDEFPVLRKCAIKMLSQPGSCMCNQVNKYITHFQGGDNFILRLNYHMWQEFMKLGDRIYKPLSFSEGSFRYSQSKGVDLRQEQIIDWGSYSSLSEGDDDAGWIDTDGWDWLDSDAGGFSDTTGGVGSSASGFSSDVGSDVGGSNHCGSPAPWRDA